MGPESSLARGYPGPLDMSRQSFSDIRTVSLGGGRLCHPPLGRVVQTKRLARMVSHTTRRTFPGEIDGSKFTFVDRHQFRRILSEQDIIEWAE